MNELEFLAMLTKYIDEYKDSHYIGGEYGQEGSEILGFLAWVTQRLLEERKGWTMIELIIAVGLTVFIIAYVIYWYFFDERPDQIRM